MAAGPRVSVVIPAYNAERYLGETIASVLAQSMGDLELILVDDGSTDGTGGLGSTFAKRDGRVRVVRQENAGLSGARNRGLEESCPASRFLIFLDADDVWEIETLAVLLEALEQRPDAVAAYGLSRFIDAEGRRVDPEELEMLGRRRQGIVGKELIAWPLSRPTTLAVLAYRNCIGTPGEVLIRRESLEAVGRFDPAMSPCEDWDLWLRLSCRGDIAFLDRVLLNYRWHGANMSSDRPRMNRAQARVRRKLLVARHLTEEQRRLVRVANRFWARYVVATRLQRARASLLHGDLRQTARHLGQAARGYGQRLFGLPV